MDWHKLQHTLFALDPTDPSEDLAKLRDAAQASAKMSEPSIDYLAESVNVPQGSLTMDRDYSVSDFAALAGIRLDERQKDGDYARGSDPMPKAKPGRTKHPLKDKLVGEEEVEENFRDAFKAGMDNYNTLGAVKGGAGAMSGKAAPAKPAAAKPAQRPNTSTNSKLSTELAPYEAQLATVLKNPRAKVAFERFLNTYAPAKTQESQDKPTQKSCGKCGQNTIVNTKKGWYCSSCDKKSTTNESIKDMLYAKLAAKK